MFLSKEDEVAILEFFLHTYNLKVFTDRHNPGIQELWITQELASFNKQIIDFQ